MYIVLQPNGQNLSLFLFLCVSVSQKTWPLRWNWVTPWENIWAGNWVIYWRRPWISCSGSDTPTAASFSTEISFFSRCRCGRLSWFYNWSQLEGKSKKTACRGGRLILNVIDLAALRSQSQIPLCNAPVYNICPITVVLTQSSVI